MLSLNKQTHHLQYTKAPTSWHELPSGNLILKHLNESLSSWWPTFFGYHLLKIGDLSTEISTHKSLIKSHIAVHSTEAVKKNASSMTKDQSHNNHFSQEKVNVIADIDDLPFVQHSVDVCLLSHALEFTLDPHHVVREANRVLIPNGYMVITGYNPVSLAGLNKLTPYRNKNFPWNMNFFLPSRIKDWLILMGYEILSDDRLLFNALNGEEKQGQMAKKWQQFAKQYFTCLGSVYVIVAKKRRLPLTPIKPKWKLKTGFKPVGVSTMNSTTPSKIVKCK